MKCRFEILLPRPGSARAARAAGEEALREVRALHRQLNAFSPPSEVSRINREGHLGAVRVETRLFRLLERCRELWERTEGAFDPTVGPLLEVWGWRTRQGRVPEPSEIEEALERVGMDKVELDPERRTFRFLRPGMSLNLASVAKGYALDRALEVLEEVGAVPALLHGGTSSVRVSGDAPTPGGWKIGLADPRNSERRLGYVSLREGSFSLSGNHLNFIRAEERKIGHVVDPRDGRPVEEHLLAAVVCTSAADADALATALLCTGFDEFCFLECLEGALLVSTRGEEVEIRSQSRKEGLWC